MSLLHQSYHVQVADTEQNYLDAVAQAMRHDFQNGLPLLAHPGRPSIDLLRALGVELVPAQPAAHTTRHDLWRQYATRLDSLEPPAPDNVADLMAWYRHTCDTITHMVVTLPGARFAPALLYAAFHRLPLFQVDSIEAAAQLAHTVRPAYLTIVAWPGDLTYAALQTLYHAFHPANTSQEHGRRVNMGCLTGRDLAALTWSVLKATALPNIMPPAQRVLSILPPQDYLANRSDVLGPEHSFKEFSAAITAQAPAEMIDLLMIHSHGTEHCIHFNTGTLCGAAPQMSHPDPDPARFFQRPACADQQGCFKRELLPTSLMTAKHMVSTACHASQFAQTVYPEQYSIALNMLEGLATTVVGAVAVSDTQPAALLLYTAAARSGMTAGEAAQLLNDFPRELGQNQLLYLLIGNPQAQVVQPLPQAYTAQAQALPDHHWQVTVEITSATLISIELPGDVPANLREICCQVLPGATPAPDPLFFAFVRQGGTTMLYLYTVAPHIPAGSYSFMVGPLSAITRGAQARLNRTFNNYIAAFSARLIPNQPIKDRIRQLEQLRTKLTRQLSELLISGESTVQAVAALMATAQTVDQHIDQADQALLHHVLQDTGTGVSEYRTNVLASFLLSSPQPSDYTCLCGTPIALQQMQHVLLDYQLTCHFCPRCGLLSDGPHLGVYGVWQRVDPAIDGQRWTVEVQLCNPTAQVVSGYAGAAMYLPLSLPRVAESRGQIMYQPRQAQITIEPGATVTFSFEVQTSGLIAINYDLGVYFISELSILYMQRDVFLAVRPTIALFD